MEKLRGLMWPRKGFVRPFQYFTKRVLRVTATPHAIAAGVAAGVIASWTPLIGFHFLLSFAIAYLIAGNMVAAALGTAFGNPLTFPFIWASTWQFGNMILGNAHAGDRQFDLVRLFQRADLSQLWHPIVKPMLVGSIPFALASGLVFYGVTYLAVKGFQSRRRARLSARAKKRLAAAVDGTSSV